MDVARNTRRKWPRTLLTFGAVALLIGVAVWAITSLMRANTGATTVDASTLVTDVAQRGTLIRSVSAQGVFAPERVRVVSAMQSGLVNQVFVKPGTAVVPGSVIAQMQNPALESAAIDARAQVDVAQANLASAREQAQASLIAQQTTYADQQSQMDQDRLQARSLAALHRKGLISDLAYERAEIQAKKSTNDVRSAHAQVGVGIADAHAKIAAAMAQVDQARAQLAADTAQVDALTVRASTVGIVQAVDVDPGMSLAQTAEIARIADTHALKAVLSVAESDVHAVLVGMRASIDTGNGSIRGRVSRIAPAAQNGTVAVDVSFSHALPPGARPDANVDGTIFINAIPNAVSIARPAGAADNSTIDVFKETAGGTRAIRTRIRLGQGSNDRVAVLSGIAPGDVVVVSDMSNYMDHATLRLR